MLQLGVGQIIYWSPSVIGAAKGVCLAQGIVGLGISGLEALAFSSSGVLMVCQFYVLQTPAAVMFMHSFLPVT